MLTGDTRIVGETIAREIGLDTVYSELLPHQKVEQLDKNRKSKGKLVFVGDGINDAPVLARADIGIAMGVKIVVLTLAALGIATMWEAVFGDVVNSNCYFKCDACYENHTLRIQ